MRGFKEFLNEESANGVVEVILILVVLIGAVVYSGHSFRS